MISALTEEVLRIRSEKDEADAGVKEINRRLREAEGKLVKLMFEQSLDAISQHGFSFSRVSKLSVKKTDEDALFKWLREHGFESTIRSTIHHATLGKVVSESIEEDGVTPDGVELSEFDIIQVRKK